ncbi:MAG: molecular chaperone DjiA [Paracoccaceae bacterium]|nr:molecular chaperone DjiA [Paracoccaceae bacterium]
MSVWTRISEALSALAKGERLAAVFDRLRTPPERTVAFTIATIALSAKMAKADGRVTRDEVSAFREVFSIPKADEESAARVFNLAREDVTGFDDYARRIRRMFDDGHQTLVDLMESLFHIATADGRYHAGEDDFLTEVGRIFGLSACEFRGIRSRFVPDAHPDPWDVLGLEPGTHLDEARAAWRRQVREHHPDRLAARGVPEEAVKLAEKRLVALNRAWEEIRRTHAL